jgi:putative oxidoreductase
MTSLDNWAPRALSVLRIIAALLFMEHGLVKLLHFPAALPGVSDPLPTLLAVAASIEIILGGLLSIGAFTRFAAFICAGQMAVSYFLVHPSRGPWPALNQGELAILYCFIFFYLIFAGPGPWSIDALRKSAK